MDVLRQPPAGATSMAAGHDIAFDAMGSRIRLLLDEDHEAGLEPAAVAAARARHFVAELEAALSRFIPSSELCRLNEDPGERVPASQLLRDAVRAGLEAARRSGGLVDPTLVDEIEAAGYFSSRAGLPSGPLAAALAEAPPRRPARARPSRRWQSFEVDDANAEIVRPAGLRFDSGGSGKGLAADLIAGRLHRYPRYLIDCGGDIRIGGNRALARPYQIYVEHPLTGELTFALRLGAGAVATSGLGKRVWRRSEGGYAHHLIDPSTGSPAWTGVISATALDDTAVEAETVAKMALLSGPEAGRAILAERGGLLVFDSGRSEAVGPISARPVPPSGISRGPEQARRRRG